MIDEGVEGVQGDGFRGGARPAVRHDVDQIEDAKAVSTVANTLSSYQKARAILDRTISAYGGLETIRSVQNFSVKMSVYQFHRNQSRKPGISESTLGSSEIIVDFRNNRYRYDVERGVIGGNRGKVYEIFDGKEGIFVDMSRRTKRPL